MGAFGSLAALVAFLAAFDFLALGSFTTDFLFLMSLQTYATTPLEISKTKQREWPLNRNIAISDDRHCMSNKFRAGRLLVLHLPGLLLHISLCNRSSSFLALCVLHLDYLGLRCGVKVCVRQPSTLASCSNLLRTSVSELLTPQQPLQRGFEMQENASLKRENNNY